ncbi:hypothetical protein L596_030587 [Steinernema carpocapsae]|uniref:Uncharacterized protein n=1 Tax=Steinernema carpocapsae TaxID=34508 RepID=A0A4U5LPT7_STECR|nr:hypothetical protein L596_030587 [Steinernema carpocapsae]
MPKKNTRRREKRKKAREEAKKVLNPAKCAARPEEKNLPKMRTETRVKQSNSKLIFDAKSNVIKGKLHTSEQQIVSKKRSAATLTPFPKQSNDKNSTKIVNKEHSKDKQEKNHVSFRSPSYLPTKDLTNTSLKADPNKGVSKKLTASNKPTITPIKDANNDNLNSKKTSQKQKQLSNGSSRKRKHELINNTKRRYQNANDSPSEPSVPDGIAPIESTSVVVQCIPMYHFTISNLGDSAFSCVRHRKRGTERLRKIAVKWRSVCELGGRTCVWLLSGNGRQTNSRNISLPTPISERGRTVFLCFSLEQCKSPEEEAL